MTQHYARMKKHGKKFEVVIDPNKAVEFRQGTLLDMREVLKDIHVYLDAAKGLRPSDDELRQAFGTVDQQEIAKSIILKGEVQLTSNQRTEMHEAKKRQILDMLHMWGIDPRNKTPHPVARLESAFDEAKIRIDDNKSAQEQIADIIKKLAPLLPIKIESKKIRLTIPAQHAHKAYGQLKRIATIVQDKWTNDGSWDGIVEIPGGMEADLYEKLNKICHGELVATHVKR